ncbi:CHAP domain-containing protein [Paraburkholderia sp. DD10]|uniref:CHAP domain-containing protein n=1 Tax=Paraburkholderia sp. DD10 TaxID=3409691 RepID=UPI003B9DFD01
MPFDKSVAASYADDHAQSHSTGNCARYVRKAIEAGGLSLHHAHFAKDYGPLLQAVGFRETTGSPQKGDVVVIQPAPGHPAGHMAIFDGSIWVSDFKQTHSGAQGFYPGTAYRQAQPPHKTYRYN